jgi:hypothetical protein
MLDEGTTIIFLTFLFAMIGYAGLTVTLLISFRRNVPLTFWRIVSLIILIHVFMVWTYRYEWDISLSVRNGYSGFLIFHPALLIILVSNFVKQSIAKALIRISFIVVTAGAIGAVFRYDVVEIYKVPVLTFATAGIIGLFRNFILNRSVLSSE